MRSTLPRRRRPGRRPALRTALTCALPLALGLSLAACSVPGAGSGGGGAAQELTGGRISAPVTPEEVAELGDVELRLLVDSGDHKPPKPVWLPHSRGSTGIPPPHL